jgi:hypothetical protein
LSRSHYRDFQVIHSPGDRHGGCVQFSAAITSHTQEVFVWTRVFIFHQSYPWAALLDCFSTCKLGFIRNCKMLYESDCHFCSPGSGWDSQLPCIPTHTSLSVCLPAVFPFSWAGHGSNLHFPRDWLWQAPAQDSCAICISSAAQCLLDSAHFTRRLLIFFLVSYESSLCILEKIWLLYTLSPKLWLVFHFFNTHFLPRFTFSVCCLSFFPTRTLPSVSFAYPAQDYIFSAPSQLWVAIGLCWDQWMEVEVIWTALQSTLMKVKPAPHLPPLSFTFPWDTKVAAALVQPHRWGPHPKAWWNNKMEDTWVPTWQT